MHPSLRPLQFLIGLWKTTNGAGKFPPRIAPFFYHEEVQFRDVGDDAPLLLYRSNSWTPDEEHKPIYAEAGIIRANPDNSKVGMMVAHNIGMTSVEEGEVYGTSLVTKLVGFAKTPMYYAHPDCTGLERDIRLTDDCKLKIVVYMATTETPDMQEHLLSVYDKIE